MVEFSKPGAYIKQISVYLENKENEKADELAKEFVKKFPNDMISHYIAAKTAFALGRYKDAESEAMKAFSKATGPDDMQACGVLASSAYYALREYAKGHDLLSKIKKIKNSEMVEKLLFAYSIAMRNEQEAMEHIDELYKLNRKAAEEFVISYLRNQKR
jgi:tetratricopeptide (TPR) repeat protein